MAPLVFFVLFLAACDNGSGPDEIDIELSTFWPNDDGNSWAFHFEQFEVGADIPALYGLDLSDPKNIDCGDLAFRLSLDVAMLGDTTFFRERAYEMKLDGTVDTGAGPKQYLEVTPGSLVVAKGAALGKAATSIPISLSSGPFEVRNDWIGYYSSHESDSSFTVVRAPLFEGASFEHRLASEFAENLWEYGWVVGMKNVVTGLGSFSALEVVYLIDYGESSLINEQGEEIGPIHSWSFSLLDLVPGVGPVFQRGYFISNPPAPELGIPVAVFHQMDLIDYRLAR